jgi:hypothetical protein
VKVDLGLSGVPASPADYAMLKAALIAAQAATPTARASSAVTAQPDPRDVLERLFADAVTDPAIAAAIDHRFASTSLPQVERKVNDASTRKVDRR